MGPVKKLFTPALRATNKALGTFGLELARRPTHQWSDDRAPDIVHTRIHPDNTYAPWISDSDFMSAYSTVKPFTMVDLYRCYELWDLAKQARSVRGEYVEVGVWRGGTGCLIATAAPTKTVYLADTFRGVVKSGPKDSEYVGGEHADTSREIVAGLINKMALSNTAILEGIFPDDTADMVVDGVALLHIDVDTYDSAKDIVAWAIPRLSVGSIIVFDDYGLYTCVGITRLVHELRATLRGFFFLHNINGHALFLRTS